MVDDNKWLNVIQDAKLLDQQAENEDYVPIMTDALVVSIMTHALVLSLNQMYTDAANGDLKDQNKKDIWSLMDKLSNYSIGGYTIKFLPEYQEIKDILKEILK